VCAPSGPVDPEALARGVAELRGLGFEVHVPEGVLEKTRFTAGSAARRAAELTSLFADPEIAGVVCARGGEGAFDLLPLLDAPVLAAARKPFLGYSDATFLHLLLQRESVVTLHGPMVARGLAGGPAGYERRSLLAGLTGAGPAYASEPDELLPIRPGEAEGRLLGGCLSILSAACGTPWALRADEDALLFIEDVDEAPYRVHRLITQLREAGALARVRGVVLGDFLGCSPPLDAGYSLEEVVLDALGAWRGPVALGLSSGHTRGSHVTLPLGTRARLRCSAEEACFGVLEPAVS
jgi:muramoyltetrapeptide carboxypeptidase